ncbi:MAG: ORF6N domain-containing protein [Campylobacterota bacterium]|nr:ORF6N domain-containing protein [Campylobacterota bacterium]
MEDINNKIYEIRGIKVMLDSDLANLYEITTGNFNKAVTRNIDRFPYDFMFELTKDEFNLIFQNGISSYGGRRKLPKVFTEQGVAMLSSVLKSKVAIDINIKIMRTFIEIRKYALSHEELAKQITSLDIRVGKGEKVDTKIMEILTQLIKKQNEQQLLKPSKTDGKIGFVK